MKDQAFLRNLEDQLSAECEQTRYSAVKELAHFNSPEVVPLLMKAVGDSSYQVRKEALKGICTFSQDMIFPMLEDLLRDQENANLRTAAMEAFPRYGNEATPYLLGLLKDQDNEVRMFSATILGDVRDPSSVEDLIETLNDPDENVKHASAESLGKIGDARAVGPLIDCLKQDFWIQYPAVIALGNIGDLTATQHLVKLLDDEMLRQAVIEALGKIGDISVIPVLAKILSKNDPSIRNDTIASLVHIQQIVQPDGSCLPDIKSALNNRELLGHLLDSLQDPDSEVKKNAVIVLGWLKEERAAGKLVELLNDYNLEEYVLGALISIGKKALPELVDRLQNPDPKIQSSLIRCIYWIGHKDGIKACLPFLRDENTEVRYHAVMVMSNGLNLEEVEDALLDLLSDPEPEIQNILVEILGRSRSKRLVNNLIHELSSEDYLRKFQAIKILGRLKNPQAYAPLQNLLDDQSDEVRAEAYSALSAIKADQFLSEILLKGIKDNSYTVRKAVARCFKKGLRDNLKSTLLVLLKDPESEVRLATIETLGRIGDASCIEDLITCFSDSNEYLQLAIIRAMGNIRDRKTTHFLTSLLKEADADLKRTALESLGKLKDKHAIPDLIRALDDPDWGVRSAAIQALAKIGDQECAAHLLEKLEDPEDIIRKEAIIALGQLGCKDAANAILPLIHNEHLQDEVVSTLEKIGVPDLELFYILFKRSNARLKCRLINLLGRLHDPLKIDFLVRILDEEFFTVRCWVAKALGEIGDRKAIPPLLGLQKEDPSEEVRKEAAFAMKRLEVGK